MLKNKGMVILNLRLCSRNTFFVAGYSVQTSLETCTMDLEKLWKDYDSNKKNLFDLFGAREDFYGVMWKTKASKNRYFYLIGIDVAQADRLPKKIETIQIPYEEYAVVSVPASLSAVEAWTEFYNKVLPENEYVPAVGHDFDFEYYPHGVGKDYELWTPVQKR